MKTVFCSYGGTIYKSLIDNNLNNQPDSSPSEWTIYGEGANRDLSNLTTTGENKINYAVGDIDWTNPTALTADQDYTPTSNGVFVAHKASYAAVGLNNWVQSYDKATSAPVVILGFHGTGSQTGLQGYFAYQAPVYKNHEYSIFISGSAITLTFYPEKART